MNYDGRNGYVKTKHRRSGSRTREDRGVDRRDRHGQGSADGGCAGADRAEVRTGRHGVQELGHPKDHRRGQGAGELTGTKVEPGLAAG